MSVRRSVKRADAFVINKENRYFQANKSQRNSRGISFINVIKKSLYQEHQGASLALQAIYFIIYRIRSFTSAFCRSRNQSIHYLFFESAVPLSFNPGNVAHPDKRASPFLVGAFTIPRSHFSHLAYTFPPIIRCEGESRTTPMTPAERMIQTS